MGGNYIAFSFLRKISSENFLNYNKITIKLGRVRKPEQVPTISRFLPLEDFSALHNLQPKDNVRCLKISGILE